MTSLPSVNLRIIVLQLLIILLFPVWFFKLAHYFQMPLPSLFSSPSAIPHEGQSSQDSWSQVNWINSVWNILLFSIFFVQHIIMSGFKWKLRTSNLWSMYPTYERLFYNIISSLLLIFILEYQKPNTLVLFTLPLAVCMPLSLIGFGLFIGSNLQMERSIFLPYHWSELFNSRQVQLKDNDFDKTSEVGITIKGVYSLMRHPMQCGLWLSYTFGSNIFSL